MSHIPEDRHKHGLVLDYTLEDNMVLQRYFEPQFVSKAGFLKRKAIREYANRLIEQYDVRSGQGPVTVARSMSGGNQQKAIIAREIDKDPELLIAVQPTRGLGRRQGGAAGEFGAGRGHVPVRPHPGDL